VKNAHNSKLKHDRRSFYSENQSVTASEDRPGYSEDRDARPCPTPNCPSAVLSRIAEGRLQTVAAHAPDGRVAKEFLETHVGAPAAGAGGSSSAAAASSWRGAGTLN
jgi:hypothetical protein